MKKKNIIITVSIITIIFLLLIALLIYSLISKNKDSKVDNNKNDIQVTELKPDFDKTYNVSEENYVNENGEFKYTGKITNNSEEEMYLECIRLNFLNEQNQSILNIEQTLNIYLDKNEEYTFDTSFIKEIDINNIKRINYSYCNE